MIKGIKIRAYPTKAQKILIDKTLGCCRLIYNKGLDARKTAYENGISIGYNETSKMLTAWKHQPEFAFLKEPDSIALQQALRDLDRAFTNFFEKRAGYPCFKKKHDTHQSYRTMNNKKTGSIRVTGHYIRIPKIGEVRVKQTVNVSNINHAVIERTPTGKYYIVLNVEFQPDDIQIPNTAIGIDMGLHDFYTDSNGNKVENPKYLERSNKKLVRAQRQLSRKIKGSKNREKQRKLLARIHEKIANQRNDFLQKESSRLIRENQTICVEDLSVCKMLKNHKLARAISSVSWSSFFQMLEYKASWHGNRIVKIPRFFASSQLCHCCGHKNSEVKDLKIRKWECPYCHAHHDRDINASINILNKGLSMI